MKSIKVINLLNLIINKGNKGEVPRYVLYDERKWEFNKGYNDYLPTDGSFGTLFTLYIIKDILNDEVEIIEEKEIEKLKLKDGKIVGNWENGSYYQYTLSAPQTVLTNKINKLIDEVNKLKMGDKEFIDMTKSNTKLLEENQKLNKSCTELRKIIDRKDEKINELKEQQKKFIEYLENNLKETQDIGFK